MSFTSVVSYAGDGTTRNYAVPFPYIEKAHVLVTVAGVAQSVEWINDATVRLSVAPASGAVVTIRRVTPKDTSLVDYEDGSTLTEADLDLSNRQIFFALQETLDTYEEAIAVLADAAQQASTIPIRQYNFTANGVQTQFLLAASPINANGILVDIDGVLQRPLTAYTVNANAVNFVAAPPNGSEITVRIIGYARETADVVTAAQSAAAASASAALADADRIAAQAAAADADADRIAAEAAKVAAEAARDAAIGAASDADADRIAADAARVAAEAAAASIDFSLYATKNNPVFTGTVTIPDGALSIADTSGLQAALDGKAAISHTHTASAITDFAEAVDDEVATLLQAGPGISVTYNDGANTLTVGTNLDTLAGSFNAGTLTLNLGGRRAAIFTHTSTATISTVTLSGAPADGDAFYVLRLTNGGAFTYTHPANTQSAGGVTTGIGALTSAGVDEILYRRNSDGSRVVASVRKDVKA